MTFKFRKLGLLFNPADVDDSPDWMHSHAQIPTPCLIEPNTLRVYFATRDSKNMSRIGYVDLSMNELSNIIQFSTVPVLAEGTLGTFDDCGVMPSWIVEHDSKSLLYYIGWNVRNTVPYHNTVGVAEWHQETHQFKRLYTGPVLERTATEPYFTGTSCVLIDNGVWKCWYMSCTSWEQFADCVEPRYHIKYAESDNGIQWTRHGVAAIDYLSPDEGGISKASVIKVSGTYYMWYSYRMLVDYKTDKEKSYKIGFATSKDGVNWIRKDNQSGITCSQQGWDSEMICYPHIFKHQQSLYMLYNGNGFGQSGFGIAVAEL